MNSEEIPLPARQNSILAEKPRQGGQQLDVAEVAAGRGNDVQDAEYRIQTLVTLFISLDANEKPSHFGKNWVGGG
jgi:hypothetical protein